MSLVNLVKCFTSVDPCKNGKINVKKKLFRMLRVGNSMRVTNDRKALHKEQGDREGKDFLCEIVYREKERLKD